MGSPPAAKSKATAMPPQITTGATHLQTEDATDTHEKAGHHHHHWDMLCGVVQDLPYEEDVEEGNH